MSKFCEKCGHELNQNIKFCGGCGEPVNNPTQPITVIKAPGSIEKKINNMIIWIMIGIGLIGVITAMTTAIPDFEDFDTEETEWIEPDSD
jgi:uncharacterized membrane protein YvbJ